MIFSTHVIAHAERLCERIAIIAEGQIRFEGLVAERARPAAAAGAAAHPRARRAVAATRCRPMPNSNDGLWEFELPRGGIEPLLKALIDGGAGIEELSIERPGLHDAFVAIAGKATAREMEESAQLGEAA